MVLEVRIPMSISKPILLCNRLCGRAKKEMNKLSAAKRMNPQEINKVMAVGFLKYRKEMTV